MNAPMLKSDFVVLFCRYFKGEIQMRNTNRWMKGVLVALLGVVVLAGCGGGAEEPDKDADGHIHKEGDKH